MSVTVIPSASGENSSILVVWFESMCVNNCTSNWNIYRVTSHCSLSLSASWLLYVLQLVKRHCVSVCVCVCVYYIYMCMARLWLVNVTVPRLLVTVHCLQNGVDESKSSLSQQRNRLDAITTGISGDFLRFCEKKVMISAITETKRGQKGGFSGVLSNPQVVGNAITSTIATLHRHKKG